MKASMPLLDRVLAQRGADLGLEDLAQRRGQRAGAQHRHQVLGLLLQGEGVLEAAQGDAGPAAADAALEAPARS